MEVTRSLALTLLEYSVLSEGT